MTEGDEDDRSWGAGIVNHGAYGDLEACLVSLAGQTRPPSHVVVYDTGIDAERLASCGVSYPAVQFESGPNIGYAAGANRVVRELQNGGEPTFVLVLNPDVVLDPEFAERLIDSVVLSPAAAIATGKLLRPDRRTLDSAGITFPRHRRPRDRGSETLDDGRFDTAGWVDAASGAAMLVRCADIDRLTIDGELFDESFFAYHEDTDLCWRARRLGFRIFYEPAAVATHARGWQKDRRQEISALIRRHSFKNHYLQLVKNETLAGFVTHLPWLLVWEGLRLGYVLLRDRPVLGAYADAYRALPDAWRKRKLVSARARNGAEAC